MKITITPTEADSKQHAVSVELPRDDLNINEVFDLIASALLGFGFADENVRVVLDKVRGT